MKQQLCYMLVISVREKIKYVCYESQKLQGVYNDTLKMPKAVERIKEYYKVENVYFYQD